MSVLNFEAMQHHTYLNFNNANMFLSRRRVYALSKGQKNKHTHNTKKTPKTINIGI